MALYYFILKTRWNAFPDVEGEEFADASAAQRHAVEVARELMHNRELDTRLWRIEIQDEDLQFCSEVFFSSIDDSIDHLAPEIRSSIDLIAHRSARLADVILRVRATMDEVRDTLARADRFLKLMPRRNQ